MSTKKPFSRKWSLHDCACLAGELAGWSFLSESEIDIGKTFLLLKNPLLRGRLS